MAASSPCLNDAEHLSCPCEQILLNLIDEMLEDRMQAEIKQDKLKKRRASRALLAEIGPKRDPKYPKQWQKYQQTKTGQGQMRIKTV